MYRKLDVIEGYRCAIYDMGPGSKYIDRYSVCLVDYPENGGCVSCLAMDETGTGFSQFCAAVRGQHLGRRVRFSDLSEGTRKHIISRLKD